MSFARVGKISGKLLFLEKTSRISLAIHEYIVKEENKFFTATGTKNYRRTKNDPEVKAGV